jgi:formate hydrogenlyase subunit 4
MIGASASSSPYGAIGSYREMVMMLIYETLLVFSVVSTGIIANTLSITEIIRYQHLHGWLIFKVPGFFLAVATFLCLVGKFHLKPFDIPDAEQEIVAGTITEYSGPLLGFIELLKTLMWYVFAALFVNLFLGGGDCLELVFAIPVFLIKSLFVVAMFTVVHVSSARYKIDQAFIWYLKYPMTLAIIGFVTALVIGG